MPHGYILTVILCFPNFQVLSQRLSQSVGLSSHGDLDEETSATRGAEMATNTITVLSKYGPRVLESNFPLQLNHTQLITAANHSTRRYQNEPMKSKYTSPENTRDLVVIGRACFTSDWLISDCL